MADDAGEALNDAASEAGEWLDSANEAMNEAAEAA